MNEEWKDIPGYNGIYKISNYGRLMSFKNKGRILKPCKVNCYRNVNLSLNGKTKTTMIHTLMSNVWMDPKPNKDSWIKHIDGNRENNRIENLVWSTRSDIFKESFKSGGHSKIDYSKGQRFLQIRNNFVVGVFESKTDIHEKLGISGYYVNTSIKERKTDPMGNFWYCLQLK